LQVSDDSKSKDFKIHHNGISMRVSPMWPNVVPHICGILLVLRHLASVLWMYYITINIHNIQPILDGSMALYVIHNTEQQLFFYEQHSCNKLYATG
jgi:hypothetical protein